MNDPTPAEVSFGLLGPVQVTAAGSAFPVGAARLRTLLAALLLRANRTVAADELADEVWDGRPSAAAATTLPSYVMRLRRGLGPVAGGRLLTRAPGYLIEVRQDGELDVRQFAALRRQADDAAAARDWMGAAASLREALELWRGSALEDIPDVYLKAREVPLLQAGWIQVQEDTARADLELGRTGVVIERVARLQAQFPYREGLSGLLMRGQVAAGRPAEALEEYARLRRTLIGELGVEPGPQIQALQAAILAGEELPSWPDANRPARPAASLTAASLTAASPVEVRRPTRPTPRQLPAAIRHFAGRTAEMMRLADLADLTGSAGPGESAATGGAVIAVISGMAGTGKTTLAVQWAHQVADRFPDGQLSINLRGFDPSGTPVTPAEAIRACLDALGVTAPELPVGFEAQVALYRSLMAGQRMLVLLDNATDEEHVRLLLPGSPACLVVITSRTQLTGLAATHGAHLLSLGLLSRQETAELLARHLGPERTTGAPAAVEELITESAGLALAAVILAARAGGTSHSLTAFAAQLRGERKRLDVMETGDAPTNLRAVFSWSYRYLTPPAARVFRLLGLHPARDVSLAAVASLAGIPPRDARAVMRELSRAHLVAEPFPGTFSVHDLLHAYAAELSEQAEAASARRAAVQRALDHYLHTARNCGQALGRWPQVDRIRLGVPDAGVTVEEFETSAAALAWFNAHQPLLASVVAWSAESGFDAHCWQLPSCLDALFDQTSRWQAMAETHQLAHQAARQIGRAHV